MLPYWLTILLLLIPPVALVAIFVGVLRFIRAWRRSWGAHRQPTGAILIAILVFTVLHAGYLAAPLLYHSNRAAIALWMTVPVAIVASLLVIGVMIVKVIPVFEHSPATARYKALILLGLLTLYLLPPMVLLLAR